MNYIKQRLKPGIYLIGVPIGNARDITLRALDILASADLLAAEDTRSMRRLMEIHGIALDGRKIVSLHDHSKQNATDALVGAAQAGQSVGYASEAGMPLIADPGFELVRRAKAAGCYVTAAPGPSAVLTALNVADLPTDSFHFAGFLPTSTGARRNALSAVKDIAATLVIFESPKRIRKTCHDAAEILGEDRKASVCRELTKKFEEVLSGTLGSLNEALKDRDLKGEIVFLVDRNRSQSDINPLLLDDMLQSHLSMYSLKDAVAQVVAQTNLKRRDVYQRALQLIEDKEG